MIKKFMFGAIGFICIFSLYLNLAWAYVIGNADPDKVEEMLNSFKFGV